MLEPTQEFLEAVEKVETQDSYTVKDLFSDFGTHTCTTVLFGGWWRVTANYKSLTKKSAAEMSKVTSTSILKASARAQGGVDWWSGDSIGMSQAKGKNQKKSER